MKLKKIIRSSLVYPVRNAFISVNYHLQSYNEVVWVIGDGRSGTTWICDLITHHKNYRQMFEPFHPLQVDRMKFLAPHLYMRPGKLNKEMELTAREVFTGKFMHERVDAPNFSMLYNGLLVKDIFANLFSCWLSMLLPEIKIVFLVRNPFAVALSKYHRRDWLWMTDPMALLNQKDLYDDYLHPFEDLIRKTSAENDFILCQILIWSIVNSVPLRQFDPSRLHIVFYEDVFVNPEKEVSKIFSFINKSGKDDIVRLDDKVIKKPSKVSGKNSTLARGKSPLTSWKNELTKHQIDTGFNILQEFGLECLYDENSMPIQEAIGCFHGPETT